MRRPVLRVWSGLALTLTVGCAPAREVVRPDTYALDGVRANFRNVPDGQLCDAEPRFLLDEYSSVNSLLSRFLRDTPEASDARWTDRQMALIEEALIALPPLVKVYGRSVAGVEACGFAKNGAWPELLRRAESLLADTRQRLDRGPSLVRYERQVRAFEAWQRDRFEAQETARRSCPSRLTEAVIYYAWREAQQTSWLFCDGAQVIRQGDQDPRLEAPPRELTRGRRLREASYFSAVSKYPRTSISSPPEVVRPEFE